MKAYDRIAGSFFLGVGAFFALYARGVDVGTWSEPGPGFLPFWGGCTLVFLSVLLLVSALRRGEPEPRTPFFPVPDAWKRVLATFLALGAFNLLLNPLGFTLATLLLVLFLVRFIFPQSWTRSLVVGVSSAAGARLLFIHFLETQLPKGFLGF